MTTTKFQIGQVINYVNGHACIYTGKIMKIYEDGSMTVINHNDPASVILWNAGYAIGSHIQPDQVNN